MQSGGAEAKLSKHALWQRYPFKCGAWQTSFYKEAKRSSMLPKKVMGRGSRMLSFEANCICSSCRLMIEGCLKSTLLIVDAADVDDVLEAYDILEPSESSLETVDLRRNEKGGNALGG